MPQNDSRKGQPLRRKDIGAKPKQPSNDLWDDPETNGKALFEQKEFQVFLQKLSRVIVKEPRGYGAIKLKLGWGAIIGRSCRPEEEWLEYALLQLECPKTVEYLNKKYKLKIRQIYRRIGYIDTFTTDVPPVKHIKRVQKVTATGTAVVFA